MQSSWRTTTSNYNRRSKSSGRKISRRKDRTHLIEHTFEHWKMFPVFRAVTCVHLILCSFIAYVGSCIHPHSQDTEHCHHPRVSLLPFYNLTHLSSPNLWQLLICFLSLYFFHFMNVI